MSDHSFTLIRPATLADAPRMHAILHAAYRTEQGNAWTSEAQFVKGERISQTELEELIEGHSNVEPFLVAVQTSDHGSETIMGCIQIQRHDCADDEAMFGLFSVSPEAQGAGIGGKLVRAALLTMKQEMGIKRAKLWVLHPRTELIAWYQKLGFTPTGETRPFPATDLALRDLHFIVCAKDL